MSETATAPFSHLGEDAAVQLSQEAAERQWRQDWPPVESEPAETGREGW